MACDRLSSTPMTLIDASTTGFVCARTRCLTSLRCSADNGATFSICELNVRSCEMTASGVSLAGSGFDVPGVLVTVLLMTYPPHASCQAGGDVTTRRQVRGGHRLEVPATRRHLRLMFPEVYSHPECPPQEEQAQLPHRYRSMCYPARPHRRQPPKSKVLRSSTLYQLR